MTIYIYNHLNATEKYIALRVREIIKIICTIGHHVYTCVHESIVCVNEYKKN